MDGNKIIAKLNHLSEVYSSKDIHQLSAAMFPGSHCPLMGAMMAIGGIEDALMLVLGTDECTFYTKKATVGGFSFEDSLNNRCYSVTIDQHDVTFGCKETLYRAFAELMEEITPKAVFLVTTCVLEVTGDDVDSMAAELQGKYNVPILPVHTEHFKSINHLPGVRDTITACLPLIRECAEVKKNRVNVLGQRLGKFYSTELHRILTERGVEVGMMLPGGCKVEDIQNAAESGVNIVVHPLGLPLAKAMEKKFGTPYVFFDKYVDPENIMEKYHDLFAHLGLTIDEEIKTLYAEAKQVVEDAKKEVAGMRYVFGNTALACFEYNAFMVSLGMEPQIIQTNEFEPEDEDYKQYILKHYDPYLCRTANIAPLQYVYDIIHPDLYLGHEYASRLLAKGIMLVHPGDINNMLGFEVTKVTVGGLIQSAKESKELKETRERRMEA